MNTFSDKKCYNFGALIPSQWEGTWDDMMDDGEWITFKSKHKLTTTQIEIIKRGFHGGPFRVEADSGDDIMPFGTHKGKPLKNLPDKYIVWLSEQSWLGKWAGLCYYVRTRAKELEESKLSKEEIKELLKF
jgi:Putative quorum-sensing-regulated virulence factor